MKRVYLLASAALIVLSVVPLAAHASAAPIKTNYFSGPVKFGSHCVLYVSSQRALDGTPWNAIAASDLKGVSSDHANCVSDQFGLFDTNGKLTFASPRGSASQLRQTSYDNSPKWGFTKFAVRLKSGKCVDLKVGPAVGVNKKVLSSGICPGGFKK